jgi:hypothetical protein
VKILPLKKTCSPSALKNLAPLIEITEIASTMDDAAKTKVMNKFKNMDEGRRKE